MFLWGLGAIVALEVLVRTSQKLDVHDHKPLVYMFSKFEEDRALGTAVWTANREGTFCCGNQVALLEWK